MRWSGPRRSLGQAGMAESTAGQNETKRQIAAILVAEDKLPNDTAIAKEVGVARSTLSRWKEDPEFNALVGDAKGQIVAQALKLPIAQKHQRIKILNDLFQRNWQIIECRSARHATAMEDSPESAARAIFGDVTPLEATTGMLVARPKIAANGKTVVEWAYDAALESAIRDELKQAAQELGQLEETLNINHTVNEFHDDRLADLSVDKLESIERLLSGEG